MMRNGRYYSNGSTEWYKNDLLHREDGPAYEYLDGTKQWYQFGEYHREDGPACIDIDGTEEWYLHGKLHRENGPARQWWNGDNDWYINGIELSEEEFNDWLIKKKLHDKLDNNLPEKLAQKRIKI